MVEFMGMHVSYPQYVRLRAIQREGKYEKVVTYYRVSDDDKLCLLQ